MPRIRYLKPDFFKDEDVAALPYEARLFFEGLWVLADKAGRLEDRSARLKAEIFPYDNVNAEKCLDLLSKPKSGSGQPFINRYATDGQRYIQILSWERHQRHHHTEAESKIPPPTKKTPSHTLPIEKGMEKGMEKHKSSPTFHAPLSNSGITVKAPLKNDSFASQAEQIENELLNQGILDDLPFILDFIKKKKIRRLNNIPAFITAWRLNPVRLSVQANLKAAQTEAENTKSKEQYEQALHKLISNFENKAGIKIETVLKNVPAKVGLTATQGQIRLCKLSRQLKTPYKPQTTKEILRGDNRGVIA